MSCDLRGCGWPPWHPGVLQIKKEDLQQKTVRLTDSAGVQVGEVPTARQPKLFLLLILKDTQTSFYKFFCGFKPSEIRFLSPPSTGILAETMQEKKIHQNVHSAYLFLMELK